MECLQGKPDSNLFKTTGVTEACVNKFGDLSVTKTARKLGHAMQIFLCL